MATTRVGPCEDLRRESPERATLRLELLERFERAFGAVACIGSDQYLYFDPEQPSLRVCPALFVCLGSPDELFEDWHTWERGAPQLALEFEVPGRPAEVSLATMLARYNRLGLRELYHFSPEGTPGSRLRAWERCGSELLERSVVNERCFSPLLSLLLACPPNATSGYELLVCGPLRLTTELARAVA